MLWPWRAIVLILATTSSVVCGAPTVRTTSNDTRNVAQTNVECIAPDGQDTPAALKSQPEKNILTLGNDTVSCSLREGDTTFIISLVRSSPLDRFTFINENTAVRGELRLAGSNQNMFDSHFTLSTRTTWPLSGGKASAQLVVDEKVTIARFSL